jgi:hypothetical protein
VSDHRRGALPRDRFFRRMRELADDPKNFSSRVDPAEFVSHQRRPPAIGRAIEYGADGFAQRLQARSSITRSTRANGCGGRVIDTRRIEFLRPLVRHTSPNSSRVWPRNPAMVYFGDSGPIEIISIISQR